MASADTDLDRLTATLQIPRADEAVRQRLRRIDLEVFEGDDAGRRFELTQERSICGRGDGVDVQLHDASVSAAHFEMVLADGAVVLRDLDSHNGIWIGRGRVEQRVALLDCAEFQAGRCHFRVHFGGQVTQVPVSRRQSFEQLCGASESTRELFAALERVASWHLPVLVLGETGTGKEEVARSLHAAAGRSGPFVVLDCGTLTPQLAEAAILGYSKGAFTGATADHLGCFEEADGGTLLLDEIGELPLELQVKLLRAVDRGEIMRVNESRVRKVDVRIVAATLRDLRADVANGRFRVDLYQRIASVVLRVPPLRERLEDIPVLAQKFLSTMTQRTGRTYVLCEDAVVRLRSLPWTGNIRQLKHVVERAAYLAKGDRITRHEIVTDDEPVPVKALQDDELFGLPLIEACDRLKTAFRNTLLRSSARRDRRGHRRRRRAFGLQESQGLPRSAASNPSLASVALENASAVAVGRR